MTQQTKTYLIAPVGIAVIAGLLWWGYDGQQLSTMTVEPIKIGFIGPLAGDVAVFGEVGKQATEIALEEINSTGGINGRDIQVVYEDGECTGKGGASAAQKLINVDRVKIIYIICSSENIAAAPITELNGVLQIAAWSNHPDVTPLKIFRLAPSDVTTAQMTAEHIRDVSQTVGILTELTDYSIGLRDVFVPFFESLDGRVVQESVEMNATEVRTQLTKILSQRPDVIFLNPNSPNLGVVMLRQLRELGYNGPLYGNFFGGSDEVRRLQEAEGMIFFADPVINESGAKTRLFEKYKERYGEYPAFEFPAASQYDAIFMLKEAIEQVGDSTAEIAQYIYDTEFEGLLGKYHFDENGDAVGIVPSVKKIQDRRAVVYEKE